MCAGKKWKLEVLVTQSCLTLCNLMNCSLPGSSVYGILQARILEWIPFSRGSSRPRSNYTLNSESRDICYMYTHLTLQQCGVRGADPPCSQKPVYNFTAGPLHKAVLHSDTTNDRCCSAKLCIRGPVKFKPVLFKGPYVHYVLYVLYVLCLSPQFTQKAHQKFVMEIQIEQPLCNDDFFAQIFLEDFFWNLKLIWIATMNISFIYKKLFLIFMVKKCSISTWQINEEQNINFIIYFSLQSGNWVTLDVSNHEIHVYRINKYPWRMAWQLTPVFLPGESHGQRSLVVYSPWGHRVNHD